MTSTRRLEQYYKKLFDEIHQWHTLAENARKKGYSPQTAISTLLTLGFHDRIKHVPEFQSFHDRLMKLTLNDEAFLRETLFFALNLLHREFGTKERLEALVLVSELTMTILTRGMVLPGFEHRFQLSIDPFRQHLKLKPNLLMLNIPKLQAALSIFILDYFRKNLLLEPFRTTDSYVKSVLSLMKRFLPSRWIERLTEDRIIFLLRKIDIELEIPDEREISTPGTWFRLMESLLCLYYLLEAIAENAPRLYHWLRLVEGHEDWNWLMDETLLLIREAPEFPLYFSEAAMKQKTSLENSPLFQIHLHFHPIFGRTDWMAANTVGVHPAVLYLIPSSALGVHFLLKFSKKVCLVQAIPTLLVKAPLIELDDGRVIRAPSDLELLEEMRERVIHVHSWGEMLIPFGLIEIHELHDLHPNGLDEQTWSNILYLRKTEQEAHHHDLSVFTDMFTVITDDFDENQSIELSKGFKQYIHPKWHLYWDQLTVQEFFDLLNSARVSGSDTENLDDLTISWDFSKQIKDVLIRLGASFQVSIENDDKKRTITLLSPKMIFHQVMKSLLHDQAPRLDTSKENASEQESVTFLLSRQSGMLFFPSGNPPIKASLFPSGLIYLSPPSLDAHGLFPINGDDNQSMDFYQRKHEEDELHVRLPIFTCPSCQKVTWRMWCVACHHPTIQARICQKGHLKPLDTKTCPECKTPTLFRREWTVKISNFLKDLEKRLRMVPSSFIGMRKITNPLGLVETPEKGFLRAKYRLKVARDGLIHVPTHFMAVTRVPTDVLTRQSAECLLKWDGLTHSGSHDGFHRELEKDSFELFPSDIIIPDSLARELVKICQFLADWLSFLEITPPDFLKVQSLEDLIGHIVLLHPQVGHVALCARIVGITQSCAMMLIHPSLASSLIQNSPLNAVHVIHLFDHFLNFNAELINVNELGTTGLSLVIDVIEPFALHYSLLEGLMVNVHRGHLETSSLESKGFPPIVLKEILGQHPKWDLLRAFLNLSTLRKNPRDQLFGMSAPLKENFREILPWMKVLSQKTIQLEQLYQTVLEHRIWMLQSLLELVSLYEHPQALFDDVKDAFLDELTDILHLTISKFLQRPVACFTCGRKFKRDLRSKNCPYCNQPWQFRLTIQNRLQKTWMLLKQEIEKLQFSLPKSLQLQLHLIPSSEDVLQ